MRESFQRSLSNGIFLPAAFIVLFPASAAFAQRHCSPSWTAAYSCMEGCGGCPANNNPNPGYDAGAVQRAQQAAAAAAAAAAVQQEHDAEIAQQQADDESKSNEVIGIEKKFNDARDADQLKATEDKLKASQRQDEGDDAPSDQEKAIGTFGENVAQPNLKPVPASTPGNDADAADQALCAAAKASNGENLTQNYDVGGVSCTGSLRHSATDLSDPIVNPATFTDQERTAPGMSEALKRIDDLQAKRLQMQKEIQQVTDERKTQIDTDKMAELTIKVDKENRAYQSNLKAIYEEETKVKAIKRKVDDQVSAQ